MRTFNRATLIGHVGNDVVLRHTQSGKPVVNLSVATSAWKKDGESATTWHRVVLWDKLAELSDKYVRKGQAVYVEGPLTSRKYVDPKGVERHTQELTARELIFLNKTPSGYEDGPPNNVGVRATDGEELAEVRANIPF